MDYKVREKKNSLNTTAPITININNFNGNATQVFSAKNSSSHNNNSNIFKSNSMSLSVTQLIKLELSNAIVSQQVTYWDQLL